MVLEPLDVLVEFVPFVVDLVAVGVRAFVAHAALFAELDVLLLHIAEFDGLLTILPI